MLFDHLLGKGRSITRESTSATRVCDFLQGGGDMGALLRAHDWSASPLGSPDAWPQSLRMAVRLMLNTKHPLYIWWGPNSACLYNDAYRQSIGPERHPHALGRPAREVWGEIWDVIEPQIEQVMSGGGATWQENQLVSITRNGQREGVYWTYSFSPIDDQSATNGVGGVMVICTETTEQMRSLQRSTVDLHRFAALFEQAPFFMAVLRGPEHRIEIVNSAYRRLVGDRNVVGLPVVEALPDAAGQGYVELLSAVYKSGQAYTANGAVYDVQTSPESRPDRRVLDFVYQPIRDAIGTVMGVLVVGVDVTDRIQSHMAAQQLASIVESSDDAIISKDLDGIIRSWNSGAERLYGYSSDEAIGNPVTILIPPELRDEEPEILRRLAGGERISHYETIRQHKTGRRIHISLTVSPVRDRTGKIVGASKVARDITETKRAQEKQSLLFREMNHRVKNLFAVAAGVVSISARSAASPKEMAMVVQARLAALGRAHDLTLPKDLDEGAVRTASLYELVRTILSPYDIGSGQMIISGPGVQLTAEASTSFALLLHEFATNSVKYGSLSAPSGRVNVQWTIHENKLSLTWSEHGGPSVRPPSEEKTGFGGVLVAASVEGLSGTIERFWHDEGLHVRVNVPLDRILNG